MKQLYTILFTTLLLALGTSLRAQPNAPTGLRTIADSAWRDDVKTILLYRNGAPLEYPVLTLGKEGRLYLEFDILRPQAEQLEWRLVHCNRFWQPDHLEPVLFMNGLASGYIDDYEYSFNTRIDYVHYHTALPDAYAQFTYSGNYAVVVLAENGDTLLTRRFCVTEQAATVEAEVTSPYDGIDREQRQELDAIVRGNINEQWHTVVAQQNGRLDNTRHLSPSGYDHGDIAYRWRPENIFAGGNTFRYFDFSNIHASIYNVAQVRDLGGVLYVVLKPEEVRAHKAYIGERNLQGGLKINAHDKRQPTLEAEYAWVSFYLPMEQPLIDGSIHIVGALTDWRLDSCSRMDYDMQHHAYTKRLLLKQGYYSYQLLFNSSYQPSAQSATAKIEGDHREMPNTYTLYVYRHAPADMADRLIAIKRVLTP